MKKKIIKGILIFLLLVSVYILLLIVVPRTYDVPDASVRESTQYWDLPTGSRIGYTHLMAKGNMQPYPVIYLHGGGLAHIWSKHLSSYCALLRWIWSLSIWPGRLRMVVKAWRYIRLYNWSTQGGSFSHYSDDGVLKKVILIGQSWVLSWQPCLSLITLTKLTKQSRHDEFPNIANT